MRLSRLRLENWRNFRNVDLGIGGRAFLVGPNASGKSNLLDALRFLRDIAVVGGGFQAAVTRRGGVKRIRCLAARQRSDVEAEVSIESFSGEAWTYGVRFNQDSQKRPLLKAEWVDRAKERVLSRPSPDDKRDPERLTQTALEQVNVNREFRVVAEFLASVNYLHIVPQLVREPDRSVGVRNDPYGGDFLEQVASKPEGTQRARLRRIADALKVAVPQLGELELWRDARGTPHLRGRHEHWRPIGAWQTEDQFSDGTLRLLGLLWAVLEGRGPLLLEEPELSLHPGVVRFLPQMFARMQSRTGRQILVSTHSADLLADEGIGLDEVFLLQPGKEGTAVRSAAKVRRIRALLDGGVSLPEVVLPETRPHEAQQLRLFGN